MATYNNLNNPQMGKFNLRKEIEKYSKYWPWFVISLIVFLLLGYLHLRYATPIYSAKASIIIKDDSATGSETDIFADLGISGMGTKSFDNEMGILRSRGLMTEVVKSLDIHIQYFIEGNVRAVEIYDNIPFSIQVLELDEARLRSAGSATLEIEFGKEFKITNLKTSESFTAKSGVPVNLGFADIALYPDVAYKNDKSFEKVTVKFSDIRKVAEHYRTKVTLTQIGESGGLIELELKDPVKQKAKDILDQLIVEYNKDAIEDKNLIAQNTANFIDERLAIINGELDSVETGKEIFKKENRLTDIQAQSQLFIQSASEYNERRQEVGTQLELTSAMLEYITSNPNSDLLPTNLGISEGGVNQQIAGYNDLILERNRILSGSSEKNPVVIGLNRKISQIRQNVVQSLQRLKNSLRIEQGDLKNQAYSIGSKIHAVPSKERTYREIERQQNIKETLYLFLLQKREENSLALAVTEPKAKIVDNAFSKDWPVSPNKRNIYLGTFILGLFVPFSIIYMREVFDNKVRKRKDIENIAPKIPFVGTIPKVSKNEAMIGENDRSVLAESFRILVTNLQYLLVNSKAKSSKGNVILVTSTIKGEGKTLTAVNLSTTLARTGKKVLLIGMDLRNPRLQQYKQDKKLLGISDYLIDDELCLADLIGKSNIDTKLDILISGGVPPNPYELIKQEKVKLMFSELEALYDYVIVDTAPAMLVADTLLISTYADTVLYLVRAGYTEKELLEFPLELREQGKIKNVSFVLNNVKLSNLNYRAKYGYGYGEVKSSFWTKKARVSSKSKSLSKIPDKDLGYSGVFSSLSK